MGHYGLGHWRVLSLASDFRAVWLVWIQVGERASGKAFGAKTLRLMLRFSELLNKVCDLRLSLLVVFEWCVGIAESGLVSAGVPCYWAYI
jgi:hypothetical protein